jgi:fatty acid desaturase
MEPMEPTPRPAEPVPAPYHPVRLIVTDDLRRSRLTVFFRGILAIPHMIWLVLWSLAALVAIVVNWLVTLVAGRTPEGLHNFLAAYLRYYAHFTAYVYLVANPFPGFKGVAGSYPIDLEIDGPERQNRWKTAFRLILVIPAHILAAVLGYVIEIIGFFGWFVCLVLGRLPQGMRDLSAYCLRFQMQTYAYGAVLTDRYPSLNAGPQSAD